ncbi:hypothetical protein [Maribellus maritimus]|uniref:hypothetical protein n=1 Tax=Maribellus maritimus TaxID=2870838 RepID=UPI001EEBA900|nr:hypothetical protein [Maribellus maritimus]MCG6191396.1 hypothetical protein [Maribellus maritimus]
MRILYIVIIGILLNSCASNKIEKLDKMKQMEFNQVVDNFMRNIYYEGFVVQLQTKPIFNIHPFYIKYPDAQNEKYPPPPTEKIIYSKDFFNTLVTDSIIDSIDAQFMYASIDSTLSFNIDTSSSNETFIKQEKLDSIFSDVSSDGYQTLIRMYNIDSYLTFSTPIFNENLTKMIITVEYYCGALCGEGRVFFLSKQKNKWDIIDSKSTWIS